MATDRLYILLKSETPDFSGVFCYLTFFSIKYIINIVGFFRQEGGETHMEHIISFIVAVAARLVGDCVSKWLDSHKKSDK